MDTDEGAAHLDAEELRERYRDWVVTMCTSRQGEVGVPTLAELERHRPQDQLYYEWRAYDMVVAALTGVARPLFRAEMSEVRDFSRAGHIVYGRAKHHLSLLLADAGLPDCGPAEGEPYAWGWWRTSAGTSSRRTLAGFLARERAAWPRVRRFGWCHRFGETVAKMCWSSELAAVAMAGGWSDK